MSAADFTNVRVESKYYDSVIIRYSYAGAGTIKLYRSTDGSSYSALQTIPAAYGSYPTLTDITVSASTLYYYKFTDDNGSTFSSVASVKTQTQFPPIDLTPKALTLPVFTGDKDVDAANLDLMRAQIEAYVNGDYGASPRKTCEVCVEDGALVLDCATGCFAFVVQGADIADINSLSINCEKFEITFDVPDGTSTEVCGWDPGAGYRGDECFQAPIDGPVTLPITMIQQTPCPGERTYYVSAPCKGDYVYECYDRDSRFHSANRNLSVTDCTCAAIFDGNTAMSSNGFTWVMRSGWNTGWSTLDHQGAAGMSMYFARVNSSCAGAPGAANILQYSIGGFGANAMSYSVEGKPLFGFAVNVPATATLRSFTGHVLLFDYINSRFTWGRYTNADLHAGTMPTVISTLAMSAITPTQISLIIDATGGNTYSLYDVTFDNDTQSETIAHSSISLGSEPLGFGVFWVANNNTGDHTARLSTGKEQVMLWWG